MSLSRFAHRPHPTWRCFSALLVAACLGGCATSRTSLQPVADACGPAARAADPAPVLQLSPAALGRGLVAQQQMAVTVLGRTHRLDVLLDVDAAAVRLALVAMGQTAATLVWDGRDLVETRAPWLPADVSGTRILSDLQLALWPDEAVRAALPTGWTLDASTEARVLRQAGEAVTTVAYPTTSRIELTQHRVGYQLVIDSRSVP